MNDFILSIFPVLVVTNIFTLITMLSGATEELCKIKKIKVYHILLIIWFFPAILLYNILNTDVWKRGG